MTPDLTHLSNEINREHEAASNAAQSALAHAHRAGELLLEAKDHFDHGDWLPWLADECPTVSVRTAQAYMRIARCWPEIAEANAQRVAHLTVGEALAWIAIPRAARPCGAARARRVPWEDLSDDERREVRRITAELETMPFTPRRLVHGRDGTPEIVSGAAGAPVYWDIVGGDPQAGRPTFDYSRSEVARKLHAFLTANRRSVVSDLVADVARRRLAGDYSVSRPILPPEAGERHTIVLSPEMLANCKFLAPILGTTTLADTVAEALRFVYEWHVFDQLVVVADSGYPASEQDTANEGA